MKKETENKNPILDFVGKYRVRAHYDQSTNDFIKTENGTIDPEFDDFYIDCQNDIEIKHGYDDVMSCFIPSTGRGGNILRKIYSDKIKEWTKESPYQVCKKLLSEEILVSIDITDVEVYFTFKKEMTDYIATICKARTQGANIKPLSIKNLPKEHYEIPEADMLLYKEATKSCPTYTMERELSNGKKSVVTIPDGRIIKSLIDEFMVLVQKYKGKSYDVNAEQRKACIKGRDFIHSIGLWSEFIEFAKTYKY